MPQSSNLTPNLSQNLTLGQVREQIEADGILREIWAKVQTEMAQDPAHDLHHLLRVAADTIRFAANQASPRLCILAALLHDVVNVPKNHPDRAKASEFSAQLADRWLRALDLPADQIVLVCDAIRDHSFSRGSVPQSILGKSLQDADRLESLGAIGLGRCLLTGLGMGAAVVHPQDPWAKNRPLDDRKFSIDHFFTKLLKLESSMQTPGGRSEAARRTRYLKNYLIQLGEELHEPAPDSLRS